MPTIYNANKYNQAKYSTGNLPNKQGQLYYGSCIAGIEVRGQIGKRWIYRRRPGNGYYDSKVGITYQDRYKYFVPSSINNVESEPWRTTFRAAVDYWQNILTAEQKKEYQIKGSKVRCIPGYNQFISEALRGEFSMYVDRGDPSTQDFTLANFTCDNTWRELDLSAFIPTIARAILCHLKFEASVKDEEILFRKQGNTNALNVTGCITKQTDKHQYKTVIVSPGDTRKIEYKATSVNITVLSLTVRGWWT